MLDGILYSKSYYDKEWLADIVDVEFDDNEIWERSSAIGEHTGDRGELLMRVKINVCNWYKQASKITKSNCHSGN